MARKSRNCTGWASSASGRAAGIRGASVCGKLDRGASVRGALFLWAVAALAAVFLVGCTAGGDPVELEPDEVPSSGGSNKPASSSSSESEDRGSVADKFDFATVLGATFVRGSVEFSLDGFDMLSTEVTQEMYSALMGSLPRQPRDGDDFPVVNVSWYDAALFCNALSKDAGLDTAYVYSSVGDENYLENLEVDFGVKSFRLPTEMEWEFAARGLTTTTYYWGTDEARKYAYYGQSKGPDTVAVHVPNEFGLYDMAGNAAEWVNDWYGPYPTQKTSNYTGAASGTLRVVRGGNWSDAIKDCEPSAREKKSPLYKSDLVGFRVVYSAGF